MCHSDILNPEHKHPRRIAPAGAEMESEMRIGRISRFLSPGYSACGCCGTTWRFVKEHVTYYTKYSGMFPLCEKCWRAKTPLERLQFYHLLWMEWANTTYSQSPPDWDTIEAAVLAGK